MTYELFYWPGLPGRGEYVRLALEAGRADYVDVVAKKGVSALTDLLDDPETVTPSFAPPFLRDGDVILGQTANILMYLGPRLGLSPKGEVARLWCNQIQLTIADFVLEAHDTHHPLGVSDYYENQKPEAAKRAADFRRNRLPKFLGWFETVLQRNPEGANYLVGDSLTYADLSLFQTIEGLRYAFPRAMSEHAENHPATLELVERVRAEPDIAAYLASDRRQSFNEMGIFRHYPELEE